MRLNVSELRVFEATKMCEPTSISLLHFITGRDPLTTVSEQEKKFFGTILGSLSFLRSQQFENVLRDEYFLHSLFILFFFIFQSLKLAFLKLVFRFVCFVLKDSLLYVILVNVLFFHLPAFQFCRYMVSPLGTVRPLYRTGVSLPSRERFLYI